MNSCSLKFEKNLAIFNNFSDILTTLICQGSPTLKEFLNIIVVTFLHSVLAPICTSCI